MSTLRCTLILVGVLATHGFGFDPIQFSNGREGMFAPIPPPMFSTPAMMAQQQQAQQGGMPPRFQQVDPQMGWVTTNTPNVLAGVGLVPDMDTEASMVAPDTAVHVNMVAAPDEETKQAQAVVDDINNENRLDQLEKPLTTDEPLPEPECADTANCVIAETPAEGMQRGDHSEEAIYAKKIELLETAVRKKVTAVLTEEAWIEEVENLVKEQARRVEKVKEHTKAEREAVRQLLKDKHTLRIEHKRKMLEAKLAEHTSKLQALSEALSQVADKQEEFDSNKSQLQSKIQSLKDNLALLQGDDAEKKQMEDEIESVLGQEKIDEQKAEEGVMENEADSESVEELTKKRAETALQVKKLEEDVRKEEEELFQGKLGAMDSQEQKDQAQREEEEKEVEEKADKVVKKLKAKVNKKKL